MSPFGRAFRGVPAHIVARAMSDLVRGINFYGCSKGMLEDAWRRRMSAYGYRNLRRVKLREIAQRVDDLYWPKVRKGKVSR